MILVGNTIIDIKRFPDGTLLLKDDILPIGCSNKIILEWRYEDDSELFAVYCLGKYLINRFKDKEINLFLPYIPNARQDRVKEEGDIFTLKYFSEIINSIGFNRVYVEDAHSAVSEALIKNIENIPASFRIIPIIGNLIRELNIDESELLLYYPDEGAMKRYSYNITHPYIFGIKNRDWKTGKILGLDIIGEAENIKDKTILIVDDICSKGGTFYHSAKKLKELGAKKIYLYVTHCENTILEGDLLKEDLIEKVYTSASIFTKEHEKIEVIG